MTHTKSAGNRLNKTRNKLANPLYQSQQDSDRLKKKEEYLMRELCNDAEYWRTLNRFTTEYKRLLTAISEMEKIPASDTKAILQAVHDFRRCANWDYLNITSSDFPLAHLDELNYMISGMSLMTDQLNAVMAPMPNIETLHQNQLKIDAFSSSLKKQSNRHLMMAGGFIAAGCALATTLTAASIGLAIGLTALSFAAPYSTPLALLSIGSVLFSPVGIEASLFTLAGFGKMAANNILTAGKERSYAKQMTLFNHAAFNHRQTVIDEHQSGVSHSGMFAKAGNYPENKPLLQPAQPSLALSYGSR